MKNEKLKAYAASDVGIGRNSMMGESAEAHGRYRVECFDRDGNLKFTGVIDNLVTTEGKNDALDKYLSGTSYTAAHYIGLISATEYSAVASTDKASSHSGWQEDTNYSQSARPTAVFSAAANGNKSLSTPLTFNITGTTTIKGCFLITSPTKGGNTGVLYSAGLFTGGDKAVSEGDTLTVSYTASL